MSEQSGPDRTIEIEREREQEHILNMDTRGRITIPSGIRSKYGINPENNRYRVSVTIHDLEEYSDDEENDS